MTPAYPKALHKPKRVAAVSPATVRAVLFRDNYLCVLKLEGCLVVATVADHRANRGSGGSVILNAPECLVAACVPCNGAKEDAHGPIREDLVGRGVRVEKASTNDKTFTRCKLMPVRIGFKWYALEGTERTAINAVDALERAVLAGARRVDF